MLPFLLRRCSRFPQKFLRRLEHCLYPGGIPAISPGRVRAPGGICEISIDPRMGRSGVIASFAERFTSESPPRLGCRTTQNRPSATFSRHFAHDTNFDLRRIASDFLTRRIRMGEGELHRRYRVREPHSTRNTTSPEKCIYTLSGVIRYVLLARRASAQARGTRVKARHRRNDRNSSLARRANGNELTNRSRLISDREKYIPIF